MSSISDAITRLRPDLNKQTRFQRQGDPSEIQQPDLNFPQPAGVLPGDELDPAEASKTSLFSSTRSRVMVGLLVVLCLGIGVGYFPHVGGVSGRSGAQEANLGAVAGATLSDNVQNELDSLETHREAAAAPVRPPETATVAAPERVMIVAMKPKQTDDTAEQPVKVDLQVRRPHADGVATTQSMPAGEAIALAGPASLPEPPRTAFAVEDEPLIMAAAPAPQPGIGEVLYEAMPSPEVGDEPPAAERRVSATSAPAAAKPKSNSLSLSGIFWDKDNPMAMIDGEIVEVGQTIGGAKVLEINPENVVLEQNGKRRSLFL